MGEHIKVDGQGFKLGTCEDLYYIRYDTLKAWAEAERVADGVNHHYLKPGIFRFRFPFPDEDELATLPPAEMEHGFWSRGFERGITVHAPAAIMEALSEHHFQITKWIGPSAERGREAVHGFNLWVPCPYGPQWEKVIGVDGVGTSQIPVNLVDVVQQKPVTGAGGRVELWTVIRCGFCAAKIRLPPDQAAILAEAIGGTHTELARRILAGYLG